VRAGENGDASGPLVMSCAWPALPSGTPALATSLGSIGALPPPDAGNLVQIGVSMTPGWTVIIRMPSPTAAHSIATAFANSRTPPFVAQQPARPADPLSPATDDMIMIEPPLARRIAVTAYFTDRNTPSRFDRGLTPPVGQRHFDSLAAQGPYPQLLTLSPFGYP
jgi:hypothetical protein